METVAFTEILCFFVVQDSGKCLQNESLTNFIKMHSVIRCICKVVKIYSYLHHICLLDMTHLPLDKFS